MASRQNAAAAAAAGHAASTAAAANNNASSKSEPTSSELRAAAMALSLSAGPPTSIRLDGLALTKLVKHSKDAHPNMASGLLLGLDLQGALEVTNLFGLPKNALRASNDDGDDRNQGNASSGSNSRAAATRHITSALALLSSVNADANPVGIYVSSFLGLGAAFTSQVLEGLKVVGTLMDKEGGASAASVKAGDGMERAVVLVHDLAQSAQGNTVVKAYRLSSDFVAAYKANDFTAKGLIDHRLTFENIFIELPLSLHNTALLDAFISTLSTPPVPAPSILPPSTSSLLSHPPTAAIPSTHANLLTLSHTPVLSTALEHTIDDLDAYIKESGDVGYQSRVLARERVKLEGNVARKRAENAQRLASGMAPLPGLVEEERKLEKLAKGEPQRLETTLMLGGLDAKARRMVEESATAVVRMEGLKAGTVE